jgi:superfamily II DNA or RNA helicase
VIGARPTSSIGLWLQQIGRGSRPHAASGKKDLLILDHAGNSQRLDVLYEDDRNWSLEGRALTGKREGEFPVRTCPACLATFTGAYLECPFCGADLRKQPQSIGEVKGELQEYKRERRKAMGVEEWRRTVTGDERREKFEEFQRIARQRGYSPKWPATKFKVIFGIWPPREWTQKADYG